MDWINAAADSQAKLEEALKQLSKAEDTITKYEHVLGIIAHDGYELSHEKIKEQRDYFIKIARRTLYPDSESKNK